jgi:hypothetical protein
VTLTDLVPTAPQGFDAWEGVFALAVLGILKLYRARVMKHRSSFVDRFGWSIIIYDVVFGIAAILTMVVSVYPGLSPHIWITRVSTTAVVIVAAWQLFEVRSAGVGRVDAAVSGAMGNATPTNDSGERRMYDRRQETRELKA